MSQFYDNPDRISYHFNGIAQATINGVDFGGSTVTSVIAVPLDGPDSATPGVGKRGRVAGVTIYDVTEDFAGSTTDAGVRVGDGSDDDLYFDSGLVLAEALDATESVYLLDDGAQIDIPAGETDVTITFVAAAGTPTGIAKVIVDIDWY